MISSMYRVFAVACFLFFEPVGFISITYGGDKNCSDIFLGSVRIGSSHPGQFGGWRAEFIKVTENWDSPYEPKRNAVQGDPTWFLKIAGEELAGLFGFAMPNDSLLLAPDTDELNGALKVVNRKLVSEGLLPIPIQFIELREGYATSRDYVLSVAHRKFGMAPAGHDRIHDTSYHTAVVFIPTIFLEYVQTHAKYLEEFEVFLKKNPSEFRALEAELEKVYRDFAERIDFGTGNFTVLLAKAGVENELPDQVVKELYRLVFDFVTPAHAISSSLDEFSRLQGPFQRFVQSKGLGADFASSPMANKAFPSRDQIKAMVRERVLEIRRVTAK